MANMNKMRWLILAPLLFLVAACAGTEERPNALPLTYKQAMEMPKADFDSEAAAAKAKAERLKAFEFEKFRNGDAVHRQVGTLQLNAAFDPLTSTGHFTFINDPSGVEGEITTLTLLVMVTEDGLVMTNKETGKLVHLVGDIGRSPDVARLIISKFGDIFAAGVSGMGAVGLRHALGGDDCGSGCGQGVVNIVEGGVGVATSISDSAAAASAQTNAEIRTGARKY